MIVDGIALSPVTQEKAAKLLAEAQMALCRRTDHLFAWLMGLQWIAGIFLALVISPRTWIGTTSYVHLHVWLAIFLGGAIASLPIYLAIRLSGQPVTRHVIAIAQMLFSALLIHLSGGRIETHFHIFGSLAILAFYRDWRVLATATLVTGLDHLLRGLYWPESIFGIVVPSAWRWLEHIGWVLFEDCCLCISIQQSLGEMFEVVARRAHLEDLNIEVERKVTERTSQLIGAQKKLVESSRRAGMAEVATNVLHNVGNVLNSVNIASSCVTDTLRKSKSVNLLKVAAMLQENESDLGHFLTRDPKGRQLPSYLSQLAEHLGLEQREALQELSNLQKNIEHIKDIVSMQQGFAKVSGIAEEVEVKEIVEDALRMNASALVRHDVHIVKDLAQALCITVEKNRVVEILVNLVTNAKQACDSADRVEKLLTVSARNGNGRVRISVSDNGTGIAAENLERIFTHGFTTKKDGHGFGLHSAALAAIEMGGSLSVQSKGSDQGATFVLELPQRPREAAIS